MGQLKREPILPPKKLMLPGKPKTSRKREPDEPRTNSSDGITFPRSGLVKMTCSKRHQIGHIVRKCPVIVQPDVIAGSCNRRPSLSNTNKCA